MPGEINSSRAMHGPQFSAEVVGNAFVPQFYRELHKFPVFSLKFYEEISKFGRPDRNGNMVTVSTRREISEKILAVDFREFGADIKVVDAQESLNGSVIVLVMGSHTRKDLVKKDFTQSFFLVPHENSYFVLNDIFRYIGEDGHRPGEVRLVNGKNKHLAIHRSKPLKVPALGSNRSVGAVSEPEPLAQLVGNTFVRQFYQQLHQSPQSVYQFYKGCSKLGRPERNGVVNSVTSMTAINEKILAMNFNEVHAVIKTVDAQEAHGGGVIVLVTGTLTGNDCIKKNFAQSFFLAPQADGYFILNDIFRYVNKNHKFSASSTPEHSTTPEDVELALAISASIQSAVAEGVPIDLTKPAIKGDPAIKSEPDTKDSNNGKGSNAGSCVMCWDAQIEGACVPCGHMAGCMSCLYKIRGKNWKCPICRCKIERILRVYAVSR